MRCSNAKMTLAEQAVCEQPRGFKTRTKHTKAYWAAGETEACWAVMAREQAAKESKEMALARRR